MKRHVWLAILAVLVLMTGVIGTAQAEILPPRGEGQIGLQSVVLCESLTVRREPRTSARTVATLDYGDLPIVTEESDGWARVVLGDSEDAQWGWVISDYIAIDPAWYRTEDKTLVYAWDSTSAKKVALLDRNTSLPILKEEGNWLIVSLRGATGWIRKTSRD